MRIELLILIVSNIATTEIIMNIIIFFQYML
jgi:hypothetical protein